MRNGQDWWFGSTYFVRFRVPKPGRLNLTSISEHVWMFACGARLKWWGQRRSLPKRRRHMKNWRPKNVSNILSDQRAQMLLGIRCSASISVSQCNMFDKLLWHVMTIMQVHCKSRVTWHLLFPCESTADFGSAGEGRSSIEEKSIAKFRRTSGASYHVMSCHNKHATTISAIHQTQCGGKRWYVN